MDIRGIADIVPDGDSFPLEVRVIRRYIPYVPKQTPKDWIYLLTDRKGDAIEAVVDFNDHIILTSLEIGKCYTFDDYICSKARNYDQVTTHAASIVFYDTTPLTPIEGADIPKYHYEFAPRVLIEKRKGDNTILSDYLCRVEKVTDVFKRNNKNMMKVILLDESAELIELTIWEQMAFTYRRKLPVGKLIALMSVQVTEYEATQLESTAITAIDIDPPIPNLKEEYARFSSMVPKKSIAYGYKESDIISVAEILTKNSNDKNNTRFCCKGIVVEIEAYRGWFNQKCPECGGDIYFKVGKSICRKRHNFDFPTFRYSLNATIADDSGKVPVVFFDGAMAELMGKDCKELVVTEGFIDSKKLPPSMIEKLQQSRVYRLRIRSDGAPVVQSSWAVTSQDTLTSAVQRPLLIQPATPAAKPGRKHVQESTADGNEPNKKAKEKMQ